MTSTDNQIKRILFDALNELSDGSQLENEKGLSVYIRKAYVFKIISLGDVDNDLIFPVAPTT